jgi:hypothetical protein
MKTSFRALLAGAALAFASLTAQAASFILVNTDPDGAGFNDPTPATPVGGNAGTTVGQQRLIAYTRALQLWGSVLKSDVPITVLGSFSPLPCSATGGVLAEAGAWNINANFPNAPLTNTWYHAALANSLAGFDLYPGADIIDGADIIAFFNGSLGTPGCIEGSTWYYGLDSHAPASQTDFLNVFMHELSHGLGFSPFFDVTTGEKLLGLNDVYMTFMRDNVTGKLYTDMTPAEVLAAQVRDQQEVWVGPNATARAPLVLDHVLKLSVTSPASVAGLKDFLGGASFGGTPTSAAYTGNTVPGVRAGTGDVNDGCSAFTNAAAVNGKIAIVRRGTCAFTVKAKNAQNAGARAVIIANNAAGGGPVAMGGTDATVTIPPISIGTNDGNALIATGGFQAAGFVPVAQLAGADAANHVKLYSPTVLAPGSTGSHWDVSATPSLLMEPNITPLLAASHNVDLTIAQFLDIGWKSEISVADCGSGSGSPGASLTGEIYAAPIFICADNAKNHGAFQSCSVHALNDLKSAGIISGATKGALGSCTAGGGS